MTRFTSAYSEFVIRLDEVVLLRVKAAALSRRRLAVRYGAEISALCRASVVLLSSHIEAYIKEVGERALDEIYSKGVCRSKIAPSFFYHLSKVQIENIRSGAQPAGIANHVLAFVNSDAGMWTGIGRFPAPINAQDFNLGFSNPSFDKVKAYFGRFGYDNFRQDFMRHLGRHAQPTINGLDQIVNIRNAIAHGDPNATKTPNEVNEMILLSRVFCRTVDGIFANWCSSKFCSIRN